MIALDVIGKPLIGLKMLKARQKSEIAIVALMYGLRNRYWYYYSYSSGPDKSDDRRFKTKDRCVKAAIDAGFTVKFK